MHRVLRAVRYADGGAPPNICDAPRRQSRRFGTAGKGPLRGGLNSERRRVAPGGRASGTSQPASPRPPGSRDREARPPPA